MGGHAFPDSVPMNRERADHVLGWLREQEYVKAVRHPLWKK